MLVLLLACRHDVDPPDDGLPATLVSSLVPAVASGGLLAATPIDLTLELSVTVDGEPAESAWVPLTDAVQRIWSVPADLAPGPVEVEFRTADQRFERRQITVTAPWFEEVAEQTGLDAYQVVDGWPTECAQSLTGFGFADVDLDGDLDLLRGHITAPAQLLLNEGDDDGDGLPTFVDRSAELGFLWDSPEGPVGHDSVASVSFADYDNDGDQDVFLGRAGANRLLENRRVPDGQPRFVDVTSTSGLKRLDQRTTNGGWGDYDGDGLLDLYEVNHSHCYPSVDVDPRNEDYLYHNVGGGHFVDVTALLPDQGGQVSTRFGFAGIWLDYDRDGDQDLWVVNDAVKQGGGSVLFANDGPGGSAWLFRDASFESGIPLPRDSFGKGVNAMGGAVADLNRDGWPDFAFSNIGPNGLMQSDASAGEPHWGTVSALYGTERGNLPWGDQSITWGTHLADFDLDGDLDLLYVGGPLKGRKVEPDALFENLGDGTMVERSWESGLASVRHGGSSAQVDLDGDGWLDVVEATWSGPLQVWHNVRGRTEPDRHWLVIDAWGDGVSVNRDGFGAIVELTRQDGTVDTCFRTPMPSMSSTGDWGCWFGLGSDAGVTGVSVLWPDGTQQSVDVPGVDRRIRVDR